MLVLALVTALGAVQVASDGIFSGAATARALPSHVTAAAGVAIYRAIARVAPAPYVSDMLARAALKRGELGAAQRYAGRLPPSASRSELLGRIALARGDTRSAQQHFIDAGDVFAIGSEVDRLSRGDPAKAYALETQLKDRLAGSGTHPDAVAEAYWRLGVLSVRRGHPDAALENYRRAVALSPLSGKYLLAAGFESYDLHALSAARQYFQRAIGVDPSSADAYAGAGMAALAAGDRTAAQAYAARSRSLNPASAPLQTLQTQLK